MEEQTKKYTMMIMSKPVQGKTKEYLEWYTGEHLLDFFKIPGMLSCRYYRIDEEVYYGDHREPTYSYLTLWNLEAKNLDDITDRIRKCLKTDMKYPLMCNEQITVYSAITRYIPSCEIRGKSVNEVLEYAELSQGSEALDCDQPLHLGKSQEMIVLSNPTSEEYTSEFESWYAGQHVHDLLRIEGVIGCRFHRLAPAQVVGNAEDRRFHYLMRFDWDTDNKRIILDEIVARKKDGRTVLSPRFSRATVNLICMTISQLLMKKDIEALSPQKTIEYVGLADNLGKLMK